MDKNSKQLKQNPDEHHIDNSNLDMQQVNNGNKGSNKLFTKDLRTTNDTIPEMRQLNNNRSNRIRGKHLKQAP